MLKREIKYNFKGFIIWSGILMSLYLMVFAIYPSIIVKLDPKILEQMISSFPDAMLKAFNMDISSISSVFGWFTSEGLMFLMLVGSLYASLLGINILSKEEANKTIEFLYSKPISRKEIVTSRILSGLFYVTLMVIAVTIFNLFGMLLSNDLELKKFLLVSLTPLFTMYPVFLISMLIGVIAKKPKKVFSYGISFALMSYFLQMIGNLSDKVKALKYLSVFELTPSRSIIQNNTFSIYYPILSILICGVAIFLIYYLYNKKEFI